MNRKPSRPTTKQQKESSLENPYPENPYPENRPPSASASARLPVLGRACGRSYSLVYARLTAALGLGLAFMLGAPRAALAQEGGSMDIAGGAEQLVVIAAAVILAVIFLRVIPDLGKRAYAQIAILLVIGGICYYLATNPQTIASIGQFFGDLLSL